MSQAYWIFWTLTALCLVFTAWGALGLWQQHLDPRRKALAKRLKTATAVGSSGPSEPGLKLRSRRRLSQWAWLEQWLQSWRAAQALDHFLQQTGLSLTVAQTLAMTALLWVLSMALGVGLGWPMVLSWAVAGLALLVLAAFLQHRRSQRMVQMGQALPDALDLIARSMQAGHAFTSALQVAAKDCAPPLSQELRAVFEEINFGVSTTQALQALSHRVASEDVQYFVVAVVIQSETGGNLAEVLKNTAQLIRERQKIAGVVRVLSAEGRISAVILSLLPFALAAAMSLLNPVFISKLWTDPLGLQLVYFSLVLMGIGILWMWKMIQIRV